MTEPGESVSHLSVVGIGGTGGYFGGRIARALADLRDDSWQTHFIARGENLAQIRDHGLVLNTPERRLVCVPTSAVRTLAEAPVPDAVLVCVKNYDLADVARQIAAHRHEDTVVIPLLNGVDIHTRLRQVLSDAFILPTCVFVGTHLERPGVVTQAGGEGVLMTGADPEHPGSVPTGLLRLFERVGISYRWSDDPRPAIWQKFVFISAFGLVTAASGMTLGEVLLDPELMAEVRGIMGEVTALARAENVPLPADVIEAAVAKAGAFPPGTKTSYQRDVEAGRRDEGDLFGGTISRMGKRHGIPTPVTERVYARVGSAATCP